jgi:hypothetical protein
MSGATPRRVLASWPPALRRSPPRLRRSSSCQGTRSLERLERGWLPRRGQWRHGAAEDRTNGVAQSMTARPQDPAGRGSPTLLSGRPGAPDRSMSPAASSPGRLDSQGAPPLPSPAGPSSRPRGGQRLASPLAWLLVARLAPAYTQGRSLAWLRPAPPKRLVRRSPPGDRRRQGRSISNFGQSRRRRAPPSKRGGVSRVMLAARWWVM